MNFNWIAKNYCQNSQFQYDHAQQALTRYSFQGDEAVLDVGCGDGKITADIAKKVKNGHVLGIDSSYSMIKFAQTTFGTTEKNLFFKIGRAEDMRFDQEFDLITSFACLHWVRDQISFLNGSKKSLKDKGKIILTLYPKHPDIWNAIEDTIQSTIWSDFFTHYENPHISYNIELYKQLCEQAELSIELLEESTPIAYFKNVESIQAFLQSWLPHTDQVYPYLQDKFIKDIVNNFIEKTTPPSDGIFGIPFKRLDIILSKGN